MNNVIMVIGVIVAALFGIWLTYATNSLQQGIVGAVVLLNCVMLINLSYRVKQN